MRKIALLLMFTFVFGCYSQINTDQSDILNLIGKEYLNNKYIEKFTKNGVAFKQFYDLDNQKNTLLKISTLDDKRFSKEITSSLKKMIFNTSEISHYVTQIDTINFTKINFKNPKLRSYTSVEKDQKQYQYYKQTVSKPLFSKDQNYAVVITSGSHVTFLKIFKKDKNNQWSYLGNCKMFP